MPARKKGRSVKDVVADLKAAKAALAKDRDRLSDLYDEVEDLVGDSNDAINNLDQAIEVLSRYV